MLICTVFYLFEEPVVVFGKTF